MSLYHSPRVVTDGLVLYLDAANKRSYPGSGVTLYDIGGSNNNFSLVNTNFYSFDEQLKAIRFFRNMPPDIEDGGYATITTSGELSALNYLHNSHTTEVWVRPNDRRPTAYDATEGANAIAVYRGFHSMWHYNASSFTYSIWGQTSGTNNVYSLSINDSITEETWIQLVAVRNENTLKLYKNGELQVSGTITSGLDGIPTTNDLRIATANYNGSFAWHADLNFGNLKMYKKALSDTEIKQNFNSLKGRYGL